MNGGVDIDQSSIGEGAFLGLELIHPIFYAATADDMLFHPRAWAITRFSMAPRGCYDSKKRIKLYACLYN
jgi:hypothetical protein